MNFWPLNIIINQFLPTCKVPHPLVKHSSSVEFIPRKSVEDGKQAGLILSLNSKAPSNFRITKSLSKVWLWYSNPGFVFQISWAIFLTFNSIWNKQKEIICFPDIFLLTWPSLYFLTEPALMDNPFGEVSGWYFSMNLTYVKVHSFVKVNISVNIGSTWIRAHNLGQIHRKI